MNAPALPKGFFSPNLEPVGRLARAVAGLILFNAAILLYVWEGPGWLSILLAMASAFLFFQAVRGWCFARACGIKTKI